MSRDILVEPYHSLKCSLNSPRFAHLTRPQFRTCATTMPTEDGTTIEPEPINLSAFASCPPDDGARDAQSQLQQTRTIPPPLQDGSLPESATTVVELPAPSLVTQANPLQQRVVHTVVLPRSETDAQADASPPKCDSRDAEPPSPTSAGSPDDSDGRLAWSLARTRLREQEGPTWPAYLSYSFKVLHLTFWFR